MKITKITKVGYAGGIIVILASIIRWFLMYPDLSQAILGISIGIIVGGFAYVYQRLVEISDDIADLNTGLDGLNIWTRNELKSYQLK